MTKALSFSVLVSLLLAIAGCSGGNGSTPDAGGTSDAGSDAGSTPDTGADVDTGTPADAGTDAAPMADAGSDAGSTTDAGAHAMVTVTDFTVFGNCMPIVAPDPIIVSWTANVSGASGTTAMLTNAVLTIDSPSPIVQRLTVDVPTFALSGGSGSQAQRKTMADANPAMACGGACGSAAHLAATFMVDGAPVMVTADGTYDCAF